MTTQFLPCLSQDLTKLFENKKNYDFIINVDKENNKKEFCVHSIILEARSSYFEDVLSNARKENNLFILDFPDISVNVFNVLIRSKMIYFKIFHLCCNKIIILHLYGI